MPSAQSYITRALRLIMVLGAGETPDAEQLQDGFETLNDMIDGWAADDLTIFDTEEVELNLTAADGEYTIGVGGDINRARPTDIYRASIIHAGNAAQPLELPISIIDELQWQAVPVKAVTSSLPMKLYIRYSFPLMRLKVWPIPSVGGSARRLKLYVRTALTSFADYTTVYTFPPGYNRAIRYNLALDLCPEYEIAEPPSVVVGKAAEYLADIRRKNIRPTIIVPDSPRSTNGAGRFNIYTGEGK